MSAIRPACRRATRPASASCRFRSIPSPCCTSTIAIPVLRFEAPAVDLLRNADGSNNWTFHHEEKPSPWTLDLERVVFTKGVVHLADAVEKADVTADVDTIDADPTYGIGWKLRGTYNGAPVTGGGKAGAVLSLKDQSAPFPVQAEFRSGATHISAEGTITRPRSWPRSTCSSKLAGRQHGAPVQLHRRAAAGNAGLQHRGPPDRHARREQQPLDLRQVQRQGRRQRYRRPARIPDRQAARHADRRRGVAPAQLRRPGAADRRRFERQQGGARRRRRCSRRARCCRSKPSAPNAGKRVDADVKFRRRPHRARQAAADQQAEHPPGHEGRRADAQPAELRHGRRQHGVEHQARRQRPRGQGRHQGHRQGHRAPPADQATVPDHRKDAGHGRRSQRRRPAVGHRQFGRDPAGRRQRRTQDADQPGLRSASCCSRRWA